MLARNQVTAARIDAHIKQLCSEQSSRADVHIWRIPLAGDEASECAVRNFGFLSMQECSRAESFLRQPPRETYVQTRIALRCLLGLYLQQHPAEVQIEIDAFGKPFIAAAADSWLCFNLAHSGAYALVAIARERRIGVDIEQKREDIDHATLAKNFFAPEEREALAQLSPPSQLKAFFDCWTRKEAYLKATGSGLSTPLDSFVVSTMPGAPCALLKVAGDPRAASCWTLRDVPTAPGYAAAFAAEGAISQFHCLDYSAALAGAESTRKV